MAPSLAQPRRDIQRHQFQSTQRKSQFPRAFRRTDSEANRLQRCSLKIRFWSPICMARCPPHNVPQRAFSSSSPTPWSIYTARVCVIRYRGSIEADCHRNCNRQDATLCDFMQRPHFRERLFAASCDTAGFAQADLKSSRWPLRRGCSRLSGLAYRYESTKSMRNRVVTPSNLAKR